MPLFDLAPTAPPPLTAYELAEYLAAHAMPGEYRWCPRSSLGAGHWETRTVSGWRRQDRPGIATWLVEQVLGQARFDAVEAARRHAGAPGAETPRALARANEIVAALQHPGKVWSALQFLAGFDRLRASVPVIPLDRREPRRVRRTDHRSDAAVAAHDAAVSHAIGWTRLAVGSGGGSRLRRSTVYGPYVAAATVSGVVPLSRKALAPVLELCLGTPDRADGHVGWPGWTLRASL